MDVHPIPQNVTSFQFKLIGDMTLKQFIYLASGAGFAYLIFILFAYDYPFVAWPLLITSALLGVSFAFLPVGSRSLDHWLAAFLKAIYSPTKRTWNKNGKTFKEDPLFKSRLITYFSGMNRMNKPNLPIDTKDQTKPQDQQHNTEEATNTSAHTFADMPVSQPVGTAAQSITTQQAPLNTNNSGYQAPPTLSSIPVAPSPEPLPTKEELGKTVDLARQAQQLQMKIIQTERSLAQIKAQAERPDPIPIDYSQQVNTILSDLQNLVNQASNVKQKIQSIQTPQPQTPDPNTQLPSREKVKVVIPLQPKQAQIALTTFPNVINGIVKNKDNNYLEGVVAVIYDKEGLPVRALKTNKLGQFTGSTPLPNGTYTLELEKDSFSFDVLQIELNGQVLPPIMITAKE